MKVDVDILRESVEADRSKKNISEWIDRIITHPQCLPEVIQLLNGPEKLAFRIGWLLETLSTIRPDLVRPFVEELYAFQKNLVLNGYRRSLAKIMANCGIPERIEGEVAEDFFSWLIDPKVEVAVKVHAMQSLFNLSLKYPDLQHEFKEVVIDQLDKNTIAFSARANKLLAKLEAR